MPMLWIVSWRNIWRNKVRSGVVILAVALGVWGLLFLLGFTRGIVRDYVKSNIELQTSHFQIHHPEFKKDYEAKFVIPNSNELLDSLKTDDYTQSFAKRTVAGGMLNTSRGARGMRIIGIEPAEETMVTNMDEHIIEGTFFEDERRNQILISDDLAEKLKLSMRKKVVLTFQDAGGEIVSAAFRISGIFNTKNTPLDMSRVFVKKSDLNKLMGLEQHQFHEIAVRGGEIDLIDQETKRWRRSFPNLLVENYKDLSPELELFNSQLRINLIIMTIIFMLALIFGIINTMLMAVLERIKEFGMLLSIGMNKAKVFLMVMLETIMLSMVGVPAGVLLGIVSIAYFKEYGLDLSNFSKAMQNYGINEVVRPYLTLEVYLFVIAAVFVTAVLAAIYPARKATGLNPAEAIRSM